MDIRFKVAARIARPVEEVFEAVADPGRLSRYFTTGGAEGRLETGATVWWSFHDFPGRFPVEVAQVQPNRLIVLHWEADEGEGAPAGAGYRTRVTIEFAPLEDGRTLVTIAEEGWRDNEAALRASYGNCEGWTHMLCALKAWIEHGINLREGFYK